MNDLEGDWTNLLLVSASVSTLSETMTVYISNLQSTIIINDVLTHGIYNFTSIAYQFGIFTAKTGGSYRAFDASMSALQTV